MVIFSAKDIIKMAKFLSNTRNSPLTDFYINSTLLSCIYRDIYSEIIGSGNDFVETIHTSANTVDISHIYKILYVGYESGSEITRSSLRTRQTGGYYIENNTLYLPSGDKVIKYAYLPETITCPDEYKLYIPSEETVFEDNINYGVDEDENIIIEPTILWGENVIEKQSWMEMEGKTIKSYRISDPYCFVSYTDGSVYLFSNKEYSTKWNPFLDKGKEFYGCVVAFTSNMETGKGVIFYDNYQHKYFYGSFVTNTVLSYPDNTLYMLMAYRLAAILASMVGLENPYLTNELLPSAETKFYQSISKGSATRVANVMR